MVYQLQQIYHCDEDVNKEGGYERAVAGLYEKYLNISFNFAVNLKWL